VRDLDSVFAALRASPFRVRIRLNAKDAAYLADKGEDVVLGHARDFIDKRLATENPRNDGKQTPMRGHPAFVAQHATATCCRSCLSKWHGIQSGKTLDAAERAHILAAIERWLQGVGGIPGTLV
jgi:hypothetical protein